MSLVRNLILKCIKLEPWPGHPSLPKFQTHRGWHVDGIQENTLSAFVTAREKGAVMVECDLRLSSDDIPVVCHDVDLKRISNRDLLVEHIPAKDLKLLAQIPSLEECLLHPEGPLVWNLELKTETAFNGDLEKAVVEVVRKTKSDKRVVFSSFNPLAISRLSKLAPEIPRALLVTNEKERRNRIWLRDLWLAPFIKFHMLNLDQNMLDESVLKILSQRKLKYSVWTVNDRTEADRFLGQNAASIISDQLLK